MGRHRAEKTKRKRHHSHHSRRDSDSEDDDSSSDYDSESEESTSSSDPSSSEEERRRRKKKARRSSGSGDKHSKLKKKTKKLKRLKEGDKKAKKSSKKDFAEISMDDYFLKSAEFRTWLSKERGLFFSDLSSEESRKLFKKFVSKWNSQSLDRIYYTGIQSSAIGDDTQSNYQWQFSSGVSSKDLRTIQDSVSTWSRSKDNFDLSGDSVTKPSHRSEDCSTSRSIGPLPPAKEPPRVIGPSRGPAERPSYSADKREDLFEREERREKEKAQFKRERKEFRKHQEMVMDELLPKATGREARVDMKRAKAEKKRERDISPDFDDSKLYGGSTISKQVKARQDQRENRAHAAAQRVSDYQAKEKARVEAILQMAKANKKEGAMW